MLYNDAVYGQYELDDPVVLKIINSPTLQRLKGVSQYGYTKPFFIETNNSRFHHSLGVYLLLKKYNAPLEEQIAGLIHDISHSAFSHCIDYAFSNNPNIQAQQIHQDNYLEEFLLKTDIPLILN